MEEGARGAAKLIVCTRNFTIAVRSALLDSLVLLLSSGRSVCTPVEKVLAQPRKEGEANAVKLRSDQLEPCSVMDEMKKRCLHCHA
jgi:hypothetical protein